MTPAAAPRRMIARETPKLAPLAFDPISEKQAQAAGFAVIEIEDQPMPKRAHRHANIEHLIPTTLHRRT